MIGERDNDNPEKVNIILWLMSCRVLRRGVENLMMNCFAEEAAKRGYKTLTGSYYKTPKNGMVSKLYESFGFELVSRDGENTMWEKSLDTYDPAKTFIHIKEEQ